MTEPLATKTAIFDVAVIGAGVVGCAMARRFALEGARVVLLEKSTDILSGASKGNSAILHTGFDAPPGSIELACMQEGYREYRDIHARLNLPLLETGALVAAWSDEDLARLPAIVEQAHGNGVDDVRQIGRDEVLALEPQLAGNVLGAVRVPGEHLIDPWSAPLAYLQQAQAHGAEACFDVEVLDAASFAIHPRKGQFVVFDKAAAALLRHILLPVPNERTKGVVFTRTVFGNLLAGPTAEEQDDREQARVDSDTLQRLIDAAVERIPGLRGMPVTATYAGLRPASEKKEYRIRQVDGRNWISVGGIRSTGLTAALGIARHVYRLYQGGRFHEAVREPLWPQVPNLAEHLPRDWQRPGYDEIVCHCEMVTRREILAALEGPLPAGDFGGLKRRTRACMGRCQGFYCNARVAELSAGRLAQPLATGSCHEHH